MASDCDKEIERIAREACMMIDDWVFGNTLAEDKYPPLKECLVRVVTDALRIPGDCVRLADGRVVKVLGTLPMTADGCVIGTNADLYSWWVPQYTDDEGICHHSSTGPIVSAPHQCYSTRAAAEAARGDGGKT